MTMNMNIGIETATAAKNCALRSVAVRAILFVILLGMLWCAPILLGLAAANARNNAQNSAQDSGNLNYSRTSAFTYDPATGLLLTETIEPDNPQLCVQTTYVYDAYGNKHGATTTNCAGASGHALFSDRTSTGNHAADSVMINGVSVSVPAGAFLTNVSNALNQSEIKKTDPRFGSLVALTETNGLTTSWQLDDFGRRTKETRADGNSTVFYYCWIAGRGIADTSSNSVSCPTPANAEVPIFAASFVHSESHNSADVKNGAMRRVYMDAAGRAIRSVTESFDGANQVGGSNRLIAEDTDYNAQGAVALSTQPYFLDSHSSTAGGGGSGYGMHTSILDSLGRPVIIYTTDPQGSQSVSFGSHGSYPARVTQINYNGLVTTTRNDQGQSRQEERNIEGKVVRMTNALGAQLAHQYDAFGNLVLTRDALQNSVAISYDVRGRKLSMHDPDTGTWSYAYNAMGEPVWQQSPNQLANGTATTMAYDALGRMTQRIEPEYISNWSYDRYADGAACTGGTGKLCESGTTSGVNHRMVYDQLGRPLNRRTSIAYGPSFASAVSYDANGRLASQTYPSGLSLNYSYTDHGFLSTLTLGSAATVYPLPATAGVAPAPGFELAAGSVLWQADSYNAWGRVEQQHAGNGVITTSAFDALTGRVLNNSAGHADSGMDNTFAMNYSYTWDSLGNLVTRTDANGDGTTGAVTDTLRYDRIGSLQNYRVSSSTIPDLQRSVSMTYNAVGAIVGKSDVGTYSYPIQGGNLPHAVQSVRGAVNNDFVYDANGNLVATTSGSYRSISYNSFNLPDSQTGIAAQNGTPQYTWQYDENHQRIAETRSNSTGTRTTWMLHPYNAGGLEFESETDSSGTISNRHFLNVGGTSIGMLVSTGNLPGLTATQTAPTPLAGITLDKVEYWHKDHLGSLVSTTDHIGNVTARYEYDPFGRRRTAGGQYDVDGTIVVDWSSSVDHGDQRGYTGHQQLDDVGIIHMNGRTFDPLLGMFMQPDTMIQNPGNLQNYNRYSYCMNNPMTCTDPSGQSWLVDQWHKIWHNPILKTAITVVAAYYAGQLAMNWYASSTAATSGFAADSVAYTKVYAAAADTMEGGIVRGAASGFTGNLLASNGDVKEAFQGATSGAAFGAFSHWETTSWNHLANPANVTPDEIRNAQRNWLQIFEKTVAESMSQGAIYAAYGKSFRAGFQSELLSAAAYEVYMAYTPWSPQALGNATGTCAKGDNDIAACLNAYNFGNATKGGVAESFNVLGLNLSLSEGSPISQFLSQTIPGMDAISKIHDDFASALPFCGATACFSTMPQAAVLSYGALWHEMGN